MALRTIDIGSGLNIHQYDDNDFDEAFNTDGLIACGTPVDADHVLRYEDISHGLPFPSKNLTILDDPYTAVIDDYFLNCDCIGGNINIALPTAIGQRGKVFIITKTDALANTVIVDAFGAETINGSLTATLTTQYQTLAIYSDGANWLLSAASVVHTHDHGTLTGLADSADHPYALLIDGTRPLTANWDAGAFEIRAETLESDIATGTAPLTITSTTVVPNLNVDQVDGYDLDQSVLIGASPTFDGSNFTGIPDGALDNSYLLADGSRVLTNNWNAGAFDITAQTLGAGTLDLAGGSITDTSGAISFGNESLTTTGTINIAADSKRLTLGAAGGADSYIQWNGFNQDYYSSKGFIFTSARTGAPFGLKLVKNSFGPALTFDGAIVGAVRGVANALAVGGWFASEYNSATNSGNSIYGLNSFAYVTGNANFTRTALDGVVGGLYEVRHQGTGTISRASSIESRGQMTVAGIITHYAGFHQKDFSKSAGTLTNLYGIDIDNLTAGTNNWSIRTGTAKCEFGGDVIVSAGGGLDTTGNREKNEKRLTSGDSPYTALTTDHILFCDTDGGAIEIDLPAGVSGREFNIKNVGTSGNDVGIDPNGAEQVFAGGAGVVFAVVDGEVFDIHYNATEGWH